MTESQYDELVGLIYEAGAQPLRLKHAMAGIVEALQVTGAHIHAIDTRTGEVVLSALT